MAMLSKERDSLSMTVRTYKSLFETTEQLIAELRSTYVIRIIVSSCNDN